MISVWTPARDQFRRDAGLPGEIRDVGVERSLHAEVVEIPAALRSYLQPGYRDHLAGKIELTDEHDLPVELPDSNCLIVIARLGA